MKFFNSAVHTLVKTIPVMAMLMMLSACSEDKKESLPELAPIEIPKDIHGLYTGRMPCDDCQTKMIRATLKEDGSLEVVQTKVTESLTVDTLAGTYTVKDSVLSLSLSENSLHWNFKRTKLGNLQYMTGAGTVYEDKDGMPMELVRIFKAPALKKKTEASAPAKE